MTFDFEAGFSMGLFEQAKAAVGTAGHSDLRVDQALEILRAYDEARANTLREHGPVGDAARLPYPKETIQWSILLLLGAIEDPAERDPLKAAYVSLADWQVREEVDTGGFDSSRLRRKLDPLALAQEFAARASPADRWLAACRDERVRLIEELKRRGFW
jgi:hypothetical protein